MYVFTVYKATIIFLPFRLRINRHRCDLDRLTIFENMYFVFHIRNCPFFLSAVFPSRNIHEAIGRHTSYPCHFNVVRNCLGEKPAYARQLRIMLQTPGQSYREK